MPFNTRAVASESRMKASASSSNSSERHRYCERDGLSPAPSAEKVEKTWASVVAADAGQ